MHAEERKPARSHLFLSQLALQDLGKERIDLFQIVIEICHVLVPARAIFGIAHRVWMNVWATRGREHREPFAKTANPRQQVLLVLRQLLDRFRNVSAGTTSAVTDVMKFVRECVLKLRGTHRRIEVKKDGRIVFDVENKTVLARLDHRIDLRVNRCVLRQVS